jgi:hypothetical protein
MLRMVLKLEVIRSMERNFLIYRLYATLNRKGMAAGRRQNRGLFVDDFKMLEQWSGVGLRIEGLE